MNGHLIAVMGIACLAVSVIAYAWMPRHTRGYSPPRDRWDEDAQRWTTVPDTSTADRLLLEELDAHLNTYATADPDLHAVFGTTTSTEGDQ